MNLFIASFGIVSALAVILAFLRRRAYQPNIRRIVLYVGERLTASFPILLESPVSLVLQHKRADGTEQSEQMRIAYGPHNVVRVAAQEMTHYIGLRDVDYAPPLPDELNLRLFDQIVHVHASRSQLTVELQISRSPTRPATSLAAVHPQLKIIARKAA